MNTKTTSRIGIAGAIAALALAATACGSETSTAKNTDSSWMDSAKYWASATATNPAKPETSPYTGPKSADGAEHWSSSGAESRIKSGTAAERAASDRAARAEMLARAEHTLMLRRTHRN